MSNTDTLALALLVLVVAMAVTAIGLAAYDARANRRARLQTSRYFEAVSRESTALIQIIDGIDRGERPDVLRAIAMDAVYPYRFPLDGERQDNTLHQFATREA
ncbi:hypothetical protein [Ancylobacter radicis]|uniref:Uncharacterized protein n=1 Tax=Ancylobacter radicis TaxID=2836179 RepID=A0ABS5R3F9_9HYPH|nr:hypothetical protein [Ancylobacter radicis]MBS9476194.1 hypothetical protein [Ancylobacter radicis]